MASTRLFAYLFILAALSGRLSNSAVFTGDFFPFGVPARDSCRSVTGMHQIILDTPVVFYNSSYVHVFISPAGLVSFGTFFNRDYNPGLNISLPYRSTVATEPLLAPLWNAAPFEQTGTICFRQTNKASLLQRFVNELSAVETDFVEFQPRLLYLATWKEVTFSPNPTQNITYQVVLATDGVNSFSRYIYGDIDPEVNYIVGFNKGDFQTGTLLGGTDPTLNVPRVTNTSSVATSIFKIDGACITFGASSCPLHSIATLCSEYPALSAQACNCSTGFEDVTRNGNCQDIDECLNNSTCPSGSECINTLGSFTCPCRSGFYTTERTTGCIDADECLINIDNCDSNAVCNNTMGGFDCTCSSGYFGDGTTCIAEDTHNTSCVEGSDDTHNTSCVEGSDNCMCVDVDGGRACYCLPGYILDSLRICRDINECDNDMTACNNRSACVNTPGSYLCGCFQGYSTAPDGITCVDINECASANLNNCHADADCVNAEGFFSCHCQVGFNGNGTHCFSGDLCSPGTHSCQICSPVMGNSHVCLCYPGFSLHSDGSSCNDVNECITGIDNCHVNATCTNTNGSFECRCKDGFYGNGVICIDIDECSSGLANCGNSRFCNNTQGGFECNCPRGTNYDSDSDQCRNDKGPVIQVIPLIKPVGQHIYGIGNTFCLEGSDDENVTITILCDQVPPLAFPMATTTWSYRDKNMVHTFPAQGLTIPFAFNDTSLTLGPAAIVDLHIRARGNAVFCQLSNSVKLVVERITFDRCGPAACDSGVSNNCTMGCIRNGTSHQCTCEIGYELLSDQVSCRDINECDLGTDNCDSNTTMCRNTEGDYSCDCLPGYEPPSRAMNTRFNKCLDIDECENGDDDCRQVCNNTPGSYECSCYSGYFLRSDSQSCEDVDECLLNTDNCTVTQSCNNTVGNYTCVCLDGFQFNSTSSDCDNIIECSTGAHSCDVETTECRDTLGSFDCICHDGYMSSSNTTTLFCIDINECDTLAMACNGSGACRNTNGSFTCMQVCGTLEVQTGLGCQVSASAIGGILAGLVFVLIIVIVVIIVILTRTRRRRNTFGKDEGFYKNPIVSTELESLPTELRIPFSGLKINNRMIGEGEFGSVYKATYRNDQVAVKFLKAISDRFDVEGVVGEIMKMKDFQHPNILTLIGVAKDNNSNPCIVMPFMWSGSLDVYLRKEENRAVLLLEDATTDCSQVDMATSKLLDYCLQIAKGMAYLSSKNIIHRDLAARNCMLGLNNVIKVSDFGLSVSVEEDKDYYKMTDITRDKLPLKWLALECLSDHKFSEASDVWSYGITCWEVFNGGRKPYPGISPMDLKENLEKGYRMDKPINLACTEPVYTMTMLSCWESNPSQRPTFSDLVDHISKCLLEKQEYLRLE